MVQNQLKITLLRSAEASIMRRIQLDVVRKKQAELARKKQAELARKKQAELARKKQLNALQKKQPPTLPKKQPPILPKKQPPVVQKKQVEIKKTNKSESEARMFYFIHNYKTLGTTICSQLSNGYKNRYYGHKAFSEWEKNNFPLKINKKALELSPFSYLNPVSIDHIHLDQLIDLNILPKHQLTKISFVMIVRDPIDRFLSICNFHNISPKKQIEKLQNNIGDNFYQSKFLQNNHNITVKTIKMVNAKSIVEWFKQFNVKIDLNRRLNVSTKRYALSDLEPAEIEFLTQFYAEDFKLYEESE
uniref:Sulfotransferase domain-containing protein n=1 Tax=viral metagenome TaxID=1070528 RepID=A0A6C0LIW5_9ZZZZ